MAESMGARVMKPEDIVKDYDKNFSPWREGLNNLGKTDKSDL